MIASVRSDLPSGTVTFVFTDVEGSTRLLDELGAETYAGVLGEHRRVVREACASLGGAEVDTQGDAFFLAFARAPDALEAAGLITERLRGGPVRVRMGVHTGSPLVTDEGYVGGDVHRAARIAASGHGGQVLVSLATAALVEAPLRDLGEHRFKDLHAPERVFQLGVEEFPPLRSLYRTNLPVPATAFLGRAQELDEVVGLLCKDGVRLVTLTGPGGTGKTRLALQAAAEVADRFPDGLWWTALAPLDDPELVLPAIAHALAVDERPGRDLLETVREQLGGKRLLIVLDNAEHLLPGLALELTRLRNAVPSLALLVTSRERLQLSGEKVWPVPALAVEEAVELFLAHSRSLGADPVDGPALRNLCSRLDNLPLALELAAARTAVFSPEQLLERVGQRLDLFKGGRDADPRQQTLRATIDWSHELLDDREQRVFRALSVFAGGCSFEAAEVVAGADPDTLQSLLDKSLLRRRDTNFGARYWMLETIREYAAERLNEADDSVIRQRHAEHVALLVSEADPHLRHGPDQQGWIERVALDYDNVRAAMRFALAEAPRVALQIVGSIAFFVWHRGGYAEAQAWVDQSLDAGSREPAGLRGRALECGAIVAQCLGDFAAAQRYAEASLAASEAPGNPLGRVFALREVGKVAMALGETERGRAIFEELAQLAEEVGDSWSGAIALNNLGNLALYDGDWANVIALCGRSHELRLRLDDRSGAALSLLNVALAQLALGRLADAGRSIRTALQENIDIGSTMGTGDAIAVTTLLAASAREWKEAAVLLGASARLADELGAVRDSYEAEELGRAERETRAALGEPAFTAAQQLGHGLSREEAIARAVAIIEVVTGIERPPLR